MRAILTIIGKDRPGIIYSISKILYQYNINILDMSQTLMDEKFVAMLNVDLKDANANFDKINQSFNNLSKESNLKIKMQNEEIFDIMSRI